MEPDHSRTDGPAVSPRQAAELLGIPPSTLRSYAVAFQSLLSGGAQATRAGASVEFRHRRYTRADLAVLGEAKVLLASGLNFQLAAAELRRRRGDPIHRGDAIAPVGVPSARGPRRPSRRPRGSIVAGPLEAVPQPSSSSIPPAASSPAAPVEPLITIVPDPVLAQRLEVIIERLDAVDARADARLGGAVALLLARIEDLERRLDADRQFVGQLVELVESLRRDLAAPARDETLSPPAGHEARRGIWRFFRGHGSSS